MTRVKKNIKYDFNFGNNEHYLLSIGSSIYYPYY